MAATVQDLQAKLQQMGVGEPSPEEFIAALPGPVKHRVEALRVLQKQHNELVDQFNKERQALEAKYEKLYAPLYEERSEIVTGGKDVPVPEGETASTEDVKGVPEFWLGVLQKCELTKEAVSDKDVEVLKFLRDIQAENLEENGAARGFKLKFTFAENPFFTNTVLEKTYFMLADDDGVLEKSEGTKIAWHPGKDVTVKIMKKKPKKGKANAAPQTKTEKVESFFNFFDPPQLPDEDVEVDEETIDELQAEIEGDYEVGATIREKLIPNAVSWYIGEAVDEEAYFWTDGDGDPAGSDDDDDEGGDDDKEAGAIEGAPGQQPQECKQQ